MWNKSYSHEGGIMKKHLITIFLLALSLVLLAQGNYYDAIGDELNSEALLQALRASVRRPAKSAS